MAAGQRRGRQFAGKVTCFLSGGARPSAAAKVSAAASRSPALTLVPEVALAPDKDFQEAKLLPELHFGRGERGGERGGRRALFLPAVGFAAAEQCVGGASKRAAWQSSGLAALGAEEARAVTGAQRRSSRLAGMGARGAERRGGGHWFGRGVCRQPAGGVPRAHCPAMVRTLSPRTPPPMGARGRLARRNKQEDTVERGQKHAQLPLPSNP